MADTLKRLYGPAQPGTTNGTLYTAPAAGAVIRTLHIANTTSSSATISLGINGTPATAANAWYSAFAVPANGLHVWNGSLYLGNGETLQGLQGTSAALTVTITGVEQ